VTEMPHVVVVGAGFAGISATAELAKEGFRVTLLDRHPYNTFQPLLYQVATGGLNAGDITYSLRYFSARHSGVRFRRANVTGIDHETKQVICEDGVRVPYDSLVSAKPVAKNTANMIAAGTGRLTLVRKESPRTVGSKSWGRWVATSRS